MITYLLNCITSSCRQPCNWTQYNTNYNVNYNAMGYVNISQTIIYFNRWCLSWWLYPMQISWRTGFQIYSHWVNHTDTGHVLIYIITVLARFLPSILEQFTRQRYFFFQKYWTKRPFYDFFLDYIVFITNFSCSFLQEY